MTGAAGQIAYSLLYMIAKGDVFGKDQPIILHLLDLPNFLGVVNGVIMELADCALPLLIQVIPTADPAVAFKDVSAAFLVGAMPRKEGMERKDLLASNVKIFKIQGQAIDKYAKKDCKILVVGNPANTNALVCSHYAPSLPRENFTAMTRLDQNRARAQIAAKLGEPVDNVNNVIIWGNHSATQFPDVRHATAKVGVVEKSVYDAINNESYLQNEFIEIIQKRGATVIAARKLSSAMSAAKAAGDHMHDWWLGTKPGVYTSMGVISDGSYGVPNDIIFSFPVEIINKQWTIVQNLNIDSFARSKLDITAKELLEEKYEAMTVCAED